MRRLAAAAVIAAASTMVGIGVAELALRIFELKPEQYNVYPPGYHLEMRPDTSLLPGVRGGVKHFTISADGLRGRPLTTAARDFRILAIGGSTTEAILLDDADAWTSVLERDLGRVGARSVWVGGAGKSGLNSRDHIVQLKYLTPQLPSMDAVVVLSGVNDLTVALSQGDHYAKQTPLSDPHEEYVQVRRAFATVPRARRLAGPPPAAWYQHLVLYDVARRAQNAVLAPRRMARQDTRGLSVGRWRAARRSAPLRRDSLPALDQAIADYTENLTDLAHIARANRQRLVFLTQPVLWNDRLSAEEEGRLWLGGVGNFMDAQVNTYYTARVLRAAMDRFNRAMLDVCAKEGVECVDLSAEMSGNPAYFYDDVHYNEAGARAVAEILARHLRATEAKSR